MPEISKTLEDHFTDWESHAFGFGYGTGEEHTIPALKAFFAAFGNWDNLNAYDYRNLEAAVTPTVAWLIISVLGHKDIIEYGTSPRFGWLTPKGERLKKFVDKHTADELLELTCKDSEYIHCYPGHCNCDGPSKCANPFWLDSV